MRDGRLVIGFAWINGLKQMECQNTSRCMKQTALHSLQNLINFFVPAALLQVSQFVAGSSVDC
jgi:hypothetical protein